MPTPFSSSRCRGRSTRKVTVPDRSAGESLASSIAAMLAPASTSPSAGSSRTRAAIRSRFRAMRFPASESRGSAAIVLLYGTSSAVAASDIA